MCPLACRYNKCHFLFHIRTNTPNTRQNAAHWKHCSGSIQTIRETMRETFAERFPCSTAWQAKCVSLHEQYAPHSELLLVFIAEKRRYLLQHKQFYCFQIPVMRHNFTSFCTAADISVPLECKTFFGIWVQPCNHLNFINLSAGTKLHEDTSPPGALQPSRFLMPEHSPPLYEQVNGIYFTLEKRSFCILILILAWFIPYQFGGTTKEQAQRRLTIFFGWCLSALSQLLTIYGFRMPLQLYESIWIALNRL